MTDVLLDCQAVSKTFGGVRALNNATLQVLRGEIVGLVGPNGSGKTTLINVVSGQFHAEQGRILLNGVDITRAKPHRLAHLGLARTYQIPRPFMSLRVLDNVALAGMFGRHAHERREAERLALEHLDFVGLAHRAHLPLPLLTLHERKFLEIARALALEPLLLLLDEVLAGLNPTEVEQGMDLIRRIHARGITLVFVEHNVRAVTSLSDRMVVLNYGTPIAAGAPGTVIRDPKVIGAYLGEEYAGSHPEGRNGGRSDAGYNAADDSADNTAGS